MPSQSYYYHYTRQLEVGRADDKNRPDRTKSTIMVMPFMLQALKNEGNQEQQFTLLQQHGLYSELKTSLPTAVHRQFETCALLLRKADTKSGGFYSLDQFLSPSLLQTISSQRKLFSDSLSGAIPLNFTPNILFPR